MTCIIGFSDGKKTWIGGDSFCGNIYRGEPDNTTKVIKHGDFIMGACGTLKILNLLQYRFAPDVRPPNCSIDRYVHTTVLDHIRSMYKTAGFMKVDNEYETQPDRCEVILGYKGSLYHIYSGLSVFQHTKSYTTTGSGCDHAAAIMESHKHLEPAERILKALQVTAKLVPSVRAPMKVLST